MIDAKRLIEQLLSGAQGGQSQQGASASPRGHAANQAHGGLAERVTGALGSVGDYARRNPLLAGTLAGGLASIVLGSKSGRKLATTALTYGGLAAIGGLAYKAYQDYRTAQSKPADAAAPAGQGGAVLLPPPADSAFAIENAPQGEHVFALELVVAMINATKADGHIDDAERAKIEARLSEGGLDEEERAFLGRELPGPWTSSVWSRRRRTRKRRSSCMRPRAWPSPPITQQSGPISRCWPHVLVSSRSWRSRSTRRSRTRGHSGPATTHPRSEQPTRGGISGIRSACAIAAPRGVSYGARSCA